MNSKSKTGWKSKIRGSIYFDQDILKIIVAKSDVDNVSLLAVHLIQGWTKDKIISEIKKTLKGIKGVQDNFVLNLPRHLVTLKNLELPSAKPEEISSMVDFQVTRLVPHPKSEIIYDYQWIKALPNQCSMIRVAVLHRKAIEHHLTILSQAGLRPRAIQLGTESIENILPGPRANAALLDIDFNQSHLAFIQDGKVLFSRSIPIGAKDFNAKEPFNTSDFSAEIEASIALFPVEQEKSKVPLFILGASSALEFLEKPLRAQLKMEIQKLDLPLKAEAIIGKENLPLVSFASLLSLLKIPPESAINLLPQDIYQTYGKTAYLMEVKRLSLMVGVALLLGVLTFMNEVRLEEKYLKSLKLKIKSIEKTASELEGLRNKITFLQDHIDRRGNCMKVISSLFKNIPEEIHFKTVGYDLNKINLRGYSPNLSKIFEFTSILEKNPLFQKIETKYARQLSDGRQEMAEFYIECTLAPLPAGGKTNA